MSGPGGATIVPYLARELPSISPDGKTYTLVLRRGLKYSDGTPVRWARLDAAVMRKAPWAPFLNCQFTDFFSRRVDLACYVDQLVCWFDYATICVR